MWELRWGSGTDAKSWRPVAQRDASTLKEGICTHGIPDQSSPFPFPIPPLTQGSKSENMGSRRSCSSPLASSLKLLPSLASQSQHRQEAPRRTVVSAGGWAGLPWPYGFLPICLLTSFTHLLQRALQSRRTRQSLQHLRFREAKLLQVDPGTRLRASHKGSRPRRTPVGRRRNLCWGWATSTTHTTSV